jgi:hypothetical protein
MDQIRAFYDGVTAKYRLRARQCGCAKRTRRNPLLPPSAENSTTECTEAAWSLGM